MMIRSVLPSLLLIGCYFLVSEIRAHDANILTNLLLVYLAAGQSNLRIWQQYGDVAAFTHDVFFRKVRQIYPCLQRCIHRNGHSPLTEGKWNIDIPVQNVTLHPHHILMGNNFMNLVFRGI